MYNILIISSSKNNLFSQGLGLFLAESGTYRTVTHKRAEEWDKQVSSPPSSSIVILLLGEGVNAELLDIHAAVPIQIPLLIVAERPESNLPAELMVSERRACTVSSSTSLCFLNDCLLKLKNTAGLKKQHCPPLPTN